MPLYDDYEIRKYIGLALVIFLVIAVFGGWLFLSIFVLPRIPQYGHQVNFIDTLTWKTIL